MTAQKELELYKKKHEKEGDQIKEQIKSLELRGQHQQQQRDSEWAYFVRKIAEVSQIPFESLKKPLVHSNGDQVSDMQHHVFELVKSLKNRDFT